MSWKVGQICIRKMIHFWKILISKTTGRYRQNIGARDNINVGYSKLCMKVIEQLYDNIPTSNPVTIVCSVVRPRNLKDTVPPVRLLLPMILQLSIVFFIYNQVKISNQYFQDWY